MIKKLLEAYDLGEDHSRLMANLKNFAYDDNLVHSWERQVDMLEEEYTRLNLLEKMFYTVGLHRTHGRFLTEPLSVRTSVRIVD